MALSGWVGWRPSPSVESASLVVLAVVATVFTVVGLAVATLAFVARVPVVAGWFGWCERIAGTVPWWLGAAALAALVGGLVGTSRVSLRYWRARPAKGAPGVVVVDTSQVFAYSVGGRAGQVVASRGLLDQMDSAERRVLFAHENAHLRFGHHRLLWVADIAALNPVMRPLRARLRFAVERAADEAAVEEVGDRALVAQTVGRVALLAFDQPTVQGLRIDGSGVVERVEALLSPAEVVLPARAVAAGTAVIALAVTLTLSQWPHLGQLITHLCHV